MRKLLMIVATTMVTTGAAQAQVRVEVDAPPPPRIEVRAPPPPEVVVAPPAIRFEAAPPLVEVQPGVRVVRDCDEEVFFSGGWYWHPGPRGVWYRTRSWRGGWRAAPARAVPGAIVRLPRGQYRHFQGRPHEWHEQRMERHAERMERHEERGEHRWERGHHGHGR